MDRWQYTGPYVQGNCIHVVKWDKEKLRLLGYVVVRSDYTCLLLSSDMIIHTSLLLSSDMIVHSSLLLSSGFAQCARRLLL